ncbi:DUF1656 domain-containing protein [Salinimonas chungwhensis]|uniref:DUF1656 domain-containing protein n=1 Tax=Salinimonas chungwhensis TaxID=265425 RepID=UPI0003667309|nr:DUF1656 domain-containing protein [Salinimonas chungwhensis]
MLEEVAVGGMLFSPLIVFIPIAFVFSVVTRFALFKTGTYQKLWRPAWCEVSLFVCYLAIVVLIAGGY